jgi:cytidylate kinase
MPETIKKNIISISGDLGSGKSTIGNLIKQQMGIELFSTGDIQRQIARKHNMTTLELNIYMEDHPEIDQEIDDHLIAFNNTDERLIVDSRMAWHFMPGSFKVYLTVEIKVAAERIYGAGRGQEETYGSLEEAEQQILARTDRENHRYKTMYGVDCRDLTNYDLVVDTSDAQPEQTARLIVERFQSWFIA